MPLKITTSAETTIRPWPNKRQRHSIAWHPRQRHVLLCLLPTQIVTSKRQKRQNNCQLIQRESFFWPGVDVDLWCSHIRGPPVIPGQSPNCSLRRTYAARLNFKYLKSFAVSVSVCVDVLESHAVSPNKLTLVSAFMLDRSRDCLLTRWVTMQRDSSKTGLTDSYFQFVATPVESDRVTTDTEFLSCTLAGRKCWKWWNR